MDQAQASSGQAIASRVPLILGILTGAVLLVGVAIRAVDDLALLPAVGSGDPLARALLTIEVALLTLGTVLAVGAFLIAYLTWRGKLRTRGPAGAFFAFMLLIGLLMSARFYSPGREVGWAVVLLSVGTLLAHLRAESNDFLYGPGRKSA